MIYVAWSQMSAKDNSFICDCHLVLEISNFRFVLSIELGINNRAPYGIIRWKLIQSRYYTAIHITC